MQHGAFYQPIPSTMKRVWAIYESMVMMVMDRGEITFHEDEVLEKAAKQWGDPWKARKTETDKWKPIEGCKDAQKN